MAVGTREEVLAMLGVHQQDLRRLGVKRCGLFGSFVRDQGQEIQRTLEQEGPRL